MRLLRLKGMARGRSTGCPSASGASGLLGLRNAGVHGGRAGRAEGRGPGKGRGADPEPVVGRAAANRAVEFRALSG